MAKLSIPVLKALSVKIAGKINETIKEKNKETLDKNFITNVRDIFGSYQTYNDLVKEYANARDKFNQVRQTLQGYIGINTFSNRITINSSPSNLESIIKEYITYSPEISRTVLQPSVSIDFIYNELLLENEFGENMSDLENLIQRYVDKFVK